MRNVSDKNCTETRKTHFVFNNGFLFPKSFRLRDIVEEYGAARQATGENTAHAYCMLGNEGYRHTLGIRNIYCFSMETMVSRKRLSITSLFFSFQVILYITIANHITIIFRGQ
jgi:hypothetical protein